MKEQDCILRSTQQGSKFIQSLGHRSRTERACVLEINLFPFPFSKEKKRLPRNMSVKARRKRTRGSFILLSVTRDT